MMIVLVLVFPIFLVLLRQFRRRTYNVLLTLKDHVRMSQFGVVTVLFRGLYPVESVFGRQIAGLKG